MNSEPKIEDLLATIRKAIDDDLGDLGANGTGSSMSSQSKGTLMRGAMREMRVNVGQELNRNTASEEIAQLRERISKNRASEAFVQAAPPKLNVTPKPVFSSTQPRTGFAGILGGDVPLGRPPLRELPPAVRPSYQPEPPQLRPTLDHDTDYGAGYENRASDDVRWENENDQVFAEPEYHPQQAYQPEQAYHPEYAEEPYQQNAYDGYNPPQALVSADTAAATNSAFNHLAETLMSRAMGERSVEDMTKELLRGMLKQWLDDNLPSLVERLVREEIERVARRGR